MSQGRPIRAYDYVNQPYERVRDALHADAGGIFRRATNAAGERARVLASSLRVQVAGMEVRKEIAIEVLGFRETDKTVVGVSREARVALRWQAAQDASLFPTMMAELVLYPLSATETQLDLHGHYTPPLGPLGAAIDTVLGNRLVEASVHQFVVDVAEQLQRDLRGEQRPLAT